MKKNKLYKASAIILFTALVTLTFAMCQSEEEATKKFPPLPTQDGTVLFNFLLKEAPELVSQIPCECCDHNLDWCYKGGCPPT